MTAHDWVGTGYKPLNEFLGTSGTFDEAILHWEDSVFVVAQYWKVADVSSWDLFLSRNWWLILQVPAILGSLIVNSEHKFPFGSRRKSVLIAEQHFSFWNCSRPVWFDFVRLIPGVCAFWRFDLCGLWKRAVWITRASLQCTQGMSWENTDVSLLFLQAEGTWKPHQKMWMPWGQICMSAGWFCLKHFHFFP